MAVIHFSFMWLSTLNDILISDHCVNIDRAN